MPPNKYAHVVGGVVFISMLQKD